MIQRIQTLYLLAATGLLASMLILPLGSFATGPDILKVSLLGNYVPLAIPSVLKFALAAIYAVVALAGLVVIFMYKSRKRQTVWIRGMILLITLSVFLLIVLLYLLHKANGDAPMSYHVGLVFPLIALILLILARKAIRKDQEIIDSLDRIR